VKYAPVGMTYVVKKESAVILETEQEYKSTKDWLQRFQHEYEELKPLPLGDDHPLQREGELEGLLGQIEDFRSSLRRGRLPSEHPKPF
jgi:hypothetical protein